MLQQTGLNFILRKFEMDIIFFSKESPIYFVIVPKKKNPLYIFGTEKVT